MKFKPESAAGLPQTDLELQYQKAVDLGKIRAGADCLFYPKFSYVGCLPYEDVAQVYLRKEQVIARLCCGTADLSPVFVMVVGKDGQVYKTEIRDQDSGKAFLEYVSMAAPHVKIGYHRQEQA